MEWVWNLKSQVGRGGAGRALTTVSSSCCLLVFSLLLGSRRRTSRALACAAALPWMSKAEPESEPSGSSGPLSSMVDSIISVITNDGRSLVGLLKGFDQYINLILVEARERVFSPTEGVEEIPLGLYIVRGENM